MEFRIGAYISEATREVGLIRVELKHGIPKGARSKVGEEFDWPAQQEDNNRGRIPDMRFFFFL